MRWRPEYKIGIPVVDTQHKRLFELIADLNLAARSGLKHSDVKKLLGALELYTKRHFNLEERYMRECGYPGLGEQQDAHSFFTNRFVELHEALSEEGLTPQIVRAIREELAQWVKDHVTGLDKEFGAYYTSKQKA